MDNASAVEETNFFYNLSNSDTRSKVNEAVGAEGSSFEEFSARLKSLTLAERKPVMTNLANRCFRRYQAAVAKGSKTEAKNIELILNSLSYVVEVHLDYCKKVLSEPSA